MKIIILASLSLLLIPIIYFARTEYQTRSFSPIGWWGSPDALNKNFNYGSGENFIIKFNDDNTYQVINMGHYQDQITSEFSNKKTGHWEYSNKVLTFIEHTSKSTSVIRTWLVKGASNSQVTYHPSYLASRCNPKIFYKLDFNKFNKVYKQKYSKMAKPN